MCCVKYKCNAGIELLTRADGWESYELGSDIDAVRAWMIMSAYNELDHSAPLVSDNGKHLIGISYDMSFLNSDVETLMAEHPEAAALGRIQENLAHGFDLIGGDVGVLPIGMLTVRAVARTVGLIVRVKEDEIDLSRTANKGRLDKIRDAIEGIVIEIIEVVIALHDENGNATVAHDLSDARKMLDVVRLADASVYHVSEADRKIDSDIFKINKKLLQLSKRPRGIAVAVSYLFPSRVKVGKESNFHIFCLRIEA